jgi:esterase FrsA
MNGLAACVLGMLTACTSNGRVDTAAPTTSAPPPTSSTVPTSAPVTAATPVDDFSWIGDGLPLWVRGSGSATTAVIAVPGGPGLGAIGTFDPAGTFVDSLGSDVLFVEYDPLVAGGLRSGASNEPDTLSLSSLADELGVVVETVRSTYRPLRIVLLGHSFGGQVAAEYASRGDGVDGLVLMSTTVHEQANAELMRTEALQRIGDRRLAGDETDLVLENIGAVPLHEVEARLVAADYDPLIEADHEFVEQALAALGGELFADGTDPYSFFASQPYTGLPAPFDLGTLVANIDASELALDDDLWGLDLRGAASRITAPVLLVHGAADGVFPIGNVEVTKAALTGTTVEEAIVPTAHFPQIEAPQETATAIGRFIEASVMSGDSEEALWTTPTSTFDPSSVAWYRDIRTSLWAFQGADAADQSYVLERIATTAGERTDPALVDTMIAFGPGHWVYEWSDLAAKFEANASKFEQAGDKAAARDAFAHAATLYAIASFPDLTAEEAEAYVLSKAAFERAGSLLPTPLESLDIPFRDGRIRAYIRFPDAVTGPLPVVVASGGIDVYRSAFWSLGSRLADAGIATVTFDIEGTGDSAQWPMTPALHEVNNAVVDALIADERFDRQRIGLYGQSFGGNPAVKTAALRPGDIAAVANVCGPVHIAFKLEPEELALVQPVTVDILERRLGTPDGDLEALVEAGSGFSLKDQGLLGGATILVPILSINRPGDIIALPADLDLVTSSSTGGQTVLIGEGSDHCPPWEEAIVLVVDWFATLLQ